RTLTDHHVARLLRHAAGDLAAARLDVVGCLLARVPLHRAGEHEREAGERGRVALTVVGPFGCPEVDARGAQLLDERAVALVGEPRYDALGNRRSDTVDGGELFD